ncbi:hypothetical protein BRADI_1g27436v3, partial [Brachypodium distachyon]
NASFDLLRRRTNAAPASLPPKGDSNPSAATTLPHALSSPRRRQRMPTDEAPTADGDGGDFPCGGSYFSRCWRRGLGVVGPAVPGRGSGLLREAGQACWVPGAVAGKARGGGVRAGKTQAGGVRALCGCGREGAGGRRGDWGCRSGPCAWIRGCWGYGVPAGPIGAATTGSADVVLLLGGVIMHPHYNPSLAIEVTPSESSDPIFWTGQWQRLRTSFPP